MDSLQKKRRLLRALNAAEGYKNLGLYEDAADELAGLSPEFQDEPEVLGAFGAIYATQNDWSRVLEKAERGLKLHPAKLSFYFQASEAYNRLGNPKGAKTIWLSAPDILRYYGIFYYNLARFEAGLGDKHRARRHLDVALKMDPRLCVHVQNDPPLGELLGDVDHFAN